MPCCVARAPLPSPYYNKVFTGYMLCPSFCSLLTHIIPWLCDVRSFFWLNLFLWFFILEFNTANSTKPNSIEKPCHLNESVSLLVTHKVLAIHIVCQRVIMLHCFCSYLICIEGSRGVPNLICVLFASGGWSTPKVYSLSFMLFVLMACALWPVCWNAYFSNWTTLSPEKHFFRVCVGFTLN